MSVLIYKYVHSDRIDILTNGFLRFTQTQSLNDPFETYPSFVELEQSLIKRQRALIDSLPATMFVQAAASFLVPTRVKQSLKEFQRNLSSQILVLSLTKNGNNLLMWSHYADNHSGFVIGFDATSPFFHPKRGKMTTPLTEVKYSDQRPSLPAFDDFEKRTNELAEIVIFNKSAKWSYEEEFRMVAHQSAADKVSKTQEGSDVYLFAYPSECLKQITFGLSTPKHIRETITTLVHERYSHVQLFETRLSDTHFDLLVVPL